MEVPAWCPGGRLGEGSVGWEPDRQPQLRESKHRFFTLQKLLCRSKSNCGGGQHGSVRICERLSDPVTRAKQTIRPTGSDWTTKVKAVIAYLAFSPDGRRLS